jgi:NADH:ubiquinone oxidoreductase subunit 3 (subunit A)
MPIVPNPFDWYNTKTFVYILILIFIVMLPITLVAGFKLYKKIKSNRESKNRAMKKEEEKQKRKHKKKKR